jgi:type I restriction enzyme, S subunit
MTHSNEWSCIRLKYLVHRSTSKSEASTRFIGLENVESWTGKLIAGQTATEGESLEFRSGDVLFGKLRPYLAKAFAADFAGTCTSEMLVLRPHSRLSQQFLLYRVLSTDFVDQVNATTFGTKMPRAEWSVIRDIVIGVPDVGMQQRICAYLEEQLARVDGLISKKQRLIGLLEEKRAALISRAVTQGLDPGVPMKDSGLEWLGRIPAHWEVKPLGSVTQRITYGFTNPMPTADEGPYMLTANDIGDRRIIWCTARRTTLEAFRTELTDKSRPRPGDILLTKDGSLGRVALFDRADGHACINQSVALLRLKESAIPEFIRDCLSAANYQYKLLIDAGGTAIKHIYITRATKMAIAIPCRREQAAIAEHVKRVSDGIESASAALRNSIDQLREYRSSLITAAVTGQLDVRKHEKRMEALA